MTETPPSSPRPARDPSPDPSKARAAPNLAAAPAAKDSPVGSSERRARRDRRDSGDRRRQQIPVAVDRRTGGDRRTVPDRRDDGKRAGEYHFDPDTHEFILEIERYKERERKTFPSWSEVLQIVKALGYVKPPK